MGFWDSVGDVGGVLSGSAAGAAAGRLQDTNVAQRADELALQRYLDSLQGANLDLNQRKFALGAPSVRAGQSVRGDVLANSQDANISGLPSYITKPTIAGGLRPSMLSKDSRSLGTDLSRQALLNQLKGDTFAPQQPLPTLSTPEEASFYEKLAGGGGTLASLLAALKGAGQLASAKPGGGASGGGGDLTGVLGKLKDIFTKGPGTPPPDYGDVGPDTTVPEPDIYGDPNMWFNDWGAPNYGDVGSDTTVPDLWGDSNYSTVPDPYAGGMISDTGQSGLSGLENALGGLGAEYWGPEPLYDMSGNYGYYPDEYY